MGICLLFFSYRMMSNRSITVEPVLLLYIAALLLQLPIQQNFLYHRAQLHVAPSNQSDIGNDNHCHKNKTSLDKYVAIFYVHDHF